MDWTGNKQTTYSTIGASNHSKRERAADDYYATDPKAVEKLLQYEKFTPEVWEPACGEGHISKVLESYGYDVLSTDLVYRGYGIDEPLDFLECGERDHREDIITNPPYKYATEFVERAIESVADGYKVAMLLKLTFLEGKRRRELFKKYPPARVYVFSDRINCGLNGNFDNVRSATCYAWFIWIKGFKGDPIIKWI